MMDILDMEGLQNEEVLFSNVGSGRELCMRCCAVDMDSNLRFQGGMRTGQWSASMGLIFPTSSHVGLFTGHPVVFPNLLT